MKNVIVVPAILIVAAIILLSNISKAHADTTSDLAKADAIVDNADAAATQNFSNHGNQLRETRTVLAKTRVLAQRAKNDATSAKNNAASNNDWTATVFNTVEANDGLYEDTVSAE